jgi:hypothetical protein
LVDLLCRHLQEERLKPAREQAVPVSESGSLGGEKGIILRPQTDKYRKKKALPGRRAF